MRYYTRENARRYEKMTRAGWEKWAESVYGGLDLSDFSSREFLSKVLPRLQLDHKRPTALELGTGVGPGALFLWEQGFQVTGFDVIPQAIEQARAIASWRGASISYDVVDVTQLPIRGESFDVIVDSYCLNHIVFAEERAAVFRGVKARLKPNGYYLVSTAVYDASRHQTDKQVTDRETGRTFDLYAEDGLFEPETGYFYEPFDKHPSARDAQDACPDTLTVNGLVYIPKRCYRNSEQLRQELAAHGFDQVWLHGTQLESSVNVHQGSGACLLDV